MSDFPRPARQLTAKKIARQWDLVANRRDEQIRSGRDVSYEHVLIPTLLRLSQHADWSDVIDVGSGTGVFTETIARRAKSATGVDMSGESVEIARRRAPSSAAIEYFAQSVESFALTHKEPRYSLAFANMVLQDTPTLDATLDAIASLLRNRGRLILTVTHPCFWPEYWGYAHASWFDYTKETAIEAPFRISNAQEPVGVTTHFHRPLSRYFTALKRAGFRVGTVLEPMPSRAAQRLYPRPWTFPRFLAIRCVASRKGP